MEVAGWRIGEPTWLSVAYIVCHTTSRSIPLLYCTVRQIVANLHPCGCWKTVFDRVWIGATENDRIVQNFCIRGVIDDDTDVPTLRGIATDHIVSDDTTYIVIGSRTIEPVGDPSLAVQEEVVFRQGIDRSLPYKNG